MPICDCEVFEICPSCASDEPTYAKALAANDEAARRSQSSSKSYTVEEIKSLARVFATEIYAGSDVDFIVEQLNLSLFLVWLGKRGELKPEPAVATTNLLHFEAREEG